MTASAAAVPHIVDRRLANGMRVVARRDGRVPAVGISLWYRVGSRHEAAGRSGFAHLFEHMMFQGSANVAKSEHFELIQAAGGRTNAYTGLDATVFSDTLPSHQLELALWLEADRMRSLANALTEATLDNQREVVLNERRKKVDNAPYGSWEERLFALCYPSRHPYHHSSWGSDRDLRAASLDDVRTFFREHYVPNNATLAMVGEIDPESAIAMVERHFGDIPAGRIPPPPLGGEPSSAGRRLETSEPAPLARLYLGCRTPPLGDDGFDVADLVTDLLTTGRAARLHARLVRGLQLAQRAEAWMVPLVDGAALLVLEVRARDGVPPASLERAIDAELDRLAEEPPAPEELDRVVLQRATRRAASLEEAEERADRLGMYASLINDPGRLGTELARDRAITGEAIAVFGRTALAPGRRSHLWFLPDGSL